MTNILILGGGFGGVRAALDLSKKLKGSKDVKITLVDKYDAQTFHPSLYEVASAYGIKHEHPFHTQLYGTVLLPFKDIFNGTGVELVQADVVHIDQDNRQVVTSAGNTLPFDYLIIALGSAVSTFGIPGVEEYAHKFKSIEDALMLNDKLEELYRLAASGSKQPPINILVGGAGFTGIELAAELSLCTEHITKRHGITMPKCTAISLIEAAPQILPMVSDNERGVIKKRLSGLGVNILENSPIAEVGPDFIKLANGQKLNGDLIIWSGGVKALDLFKQVGGLELDERGRILVNEHLQTKNNKNIFAVGDNIVFIDPQTQKPIPQMAFLAVEQGRIAAQNIAGLMAGNGGDKMARLTRYNPKYNVWIAPVGGKYALSHLGGFNFYGFLGYLVRQAVDLRYFMSVLPLRKAFKMFFRNLRDFSRND